MNTSVGFLAFLSLLVAFMARKCEALWPNKEGERGEYVAKTKALNPKCRDMVDVDYCNAVKDAKRCAVPVYQQRCRFTCGVCLEQPTELQRVREHRYRNHECRDIGSEEFCQLMKSTSTCRRQRYRPRVHGLARYCRKTCGHCGIMQRKQDESCVDRPICEKLRNFYKIRHCGKLPHPLRKRAMRKCPNLCGICVSASAEEEPQATIATQQLVTPSERVRQPHPEVELIKRQYTDDEARSGVFYIYTKYFSL